MRGKERVPATADVGLGLGGGGRYLHRGLVGATYRVGRHDLRVVGLSVVGPDRVLMYLGRVDDGGLLHLQKKLVELSVPLGMIRLGRVRARAQRMSGRVPLVTRAPLLLGPRRAVRSLPSSRADERRAYILGVLSSTTF